jgi:colicin import membrane protein
MVRKAALLLSALLLVGCQKPPVKELEAAQQALAQAEKAGAPKLAPERYKEAEAALRQARQKAEAKDYYGALASATAAAEKGRTAAKAATNAITMAKGAVDVAEAEVQAKLDEVAAIRQEATENKVPDDVFASLNALADTTKQQAEALPAQATEDVIATQKTAEALKAQAAGLPGQFREVLDKWLADHPKKAAKPPVKKK